MGTNSIRFHRMFCVTPERIYQACKDLHRHRESRFSAFVKKLLRHLGSFSEEHRTGRGLWRRKAGYLHGRLLLNALERARTRTTCQDCVRSTPLEDKSGPPRETIPYAGTTFSYLFCGKWGAIYVQNRLERSSHTVPRRFP